STIQEVSRKHRIPYTTLERIYYSIASKKAKERQTATEASFQEGMVLSLDEIAVKKGHQYETVFMQSFSLQNVLKMITVTVKWQKKW
ncbi:hypothetical protein HNR78_002500, partial [Parageobacillus toebii NBRC 107807]|nr:hypothetical protein [Parageobacillus toebii NBRC 107807]